VKIVFLGSYIDVPIPRVGDLLQIEERAIYKVKRIKYKYMTCKEGDYSNVFLDLEVVEE
jgi:hypothetical protein